MHSEKNLLCVGNLVLSYWVKAIATIVKNGNCKADKPVACDACCKDTNGGYYSGCDVDECHQYCIEAEQEYVKVTAEAAITAAVTQQSGICYGSTEVNYQKYYYAFHSKHVRHSSSRCLADLVQMDAL